MGAITNPTSGADAPRIPQRPGSRSPNINPDFFARGAPLTHGSNMKGHGTSGGQSYKTGSNHNLDVLRFSTLHGIL
eukprot:1345309-Pyramimonas_sp.AAC.1